jgi:hypothetical protein
LQNPSQTNGHNLTNVRYEPAELSGTKRYSSETKEIMRMKKQNKNIRDLYRGISEFKKGYQPRTNLVKDKNGNLLADSHSNLNRWKNYFS